MSWRRLLVVARDECALTLRRPMVWTLIVLLLLLTWGISKGYVQIVVGSGDATVGGKKAFLTSEFALTQILAIFPFLFYSFFVAAAAGLSVIRDEEARVLEILQSTPLRPAEYAWGKFAGVVAAFLVVLAINVLLLVLFLSVLPNADMLETRGPFALGSYLRPTLAFAIPTIVFMAGVSFGMGAGFRRAILVFALPISLLILCSTFLWTWSPAWLAEPVNRALMFADMGGLRWLRETWLEVDRGAQFYNTQPVAYDALIVGNRLFWLAVGLVSAALGVRRFARTARAAHAVAPDAVARALAQPATTPVPEALPSPVTPRAADLGALGMRKGPTSAWQTMRVTARAETRELRSRAGLYLFVPLIVVQIVGGALTALGAFDTPLLLTPGQIAVTQLQQMAVWVSLLLVFYGVESMERERSTRLDAIHDTLPFRTGALLAGKLLSLAVVWLVIALAALLAAFVIVLVQGKVPFSLLPFALLWGLLYLPSFLAFATFVFAAYALTRNRYTTYAVALVALVATLWADLTQRLTWITNWPLWSGLGWSDMSVLEFDRSALVLNRLFWLSMAAVFATIAVRWYPRRSRDAISILHAFSPGRWGRGLVRAVPLLAVPFLLGALLWRDLEQGPAGSRAEKLSKDYWKKNLATWKDVRFPWLKDADVDVTIEPGERTYSVRGAYVIQNHRDTTLRTIAMTVGFWDAMKWTADGAPIVPDTASHLYVFTLKRPLGPRDSVRIGFSYRGDVSHASKRGRAGMEFIVPSAAVMTSFGPRWFPYLGYDESIGVEDENRYEPRQYPDDWYAGVTPALFGSQLPMRVRTRITTPDDLISNGVGEKLSDSVRDGRRTTVWETDVPVMAFNIVAGRYAEKLGRGTALYYHPAHTYNVDEMLSALDASRRWYGEWFGAYPWKMLKISEFPALAVYAQGFPTNISFSENIGFLTKSEPRTNLAFMVTAHEIAHQWWGNMLQPGAGPGTNLLSEGMSHFSTLLLVEREKGTRAALEMRQRFETRYAEGRRADAERKLYRIDGSKEGDGTVTYDKGGWVFWMLTERMGREAALRGMREFIARFRGTEDHAALEDFTSHMRAYAADTAAYDDFVRQWFDTVHVPEYKVERATARPFAEGEWETEAVIRNVGTGRMPLEVAVVRGERFPEDSTKRKGGPYAQSLATTTLGAGEAGTVRIRSSFEPEKVVVDPDVKVLQLRRKLAELTVVKR